MKNLKNILGAITALTFLVSCGSGHRENNTTTIQETPKALKDDKLDIKSYSRSGDLTEALYQELVSQNPALKKLEDDLDAFAPQPHAVTGKFDKYNNKSNSYYSSANHIATAITDSLLKLKIISLISASDEKYVSKTTALNALIKQISKNKATLNDHHSVLKIVLTLPMIEKYQDDNMPDRKEFKELIKEQENLIFQTDSLTPKH